MRLYPTGLREQTEGGEKVVFRAVFQDESDLGDAGTPTCDTWRSVNEFQVNGRGLYEFVFEVVDGEAMRLEVPALGLVLKR